jgi:hypothetical protein
MKESIVWGNLMFVPEPKRTMDWQPIETAPKDGTWVLLSGGKIYYGWDGDSQPGVVSGQFSHWFNGSERSGGAWQFAWYDGGYYGEYESPTHWMPLPKPPA